MGAEQRIDMQQPSDISPQAELEADPVQVENIWKAIAENPQSSLVDYLNSPEGQQIAFTAGGGLPLIFGDESNELWIKTREVIAKKGYVELIGISFSEQELLALGQFYRFLKLKGINLHCIDERIVKNQENSQVQVHCKCGACAAFGAEVAAELSQQINVEEILHDQLDPGAAKQPIHEKLAAHHDSMAILVSINGASAPQEVTIDTLQREHALPFNVSLPLMLIEEFCANTELFPSQDGDVLVRALIKWNVQIASTIIEGNHNHLASFEDRTLLVLDRIGLGTDQSELESQLITAINAIKEFRFIEISD